MQSKNLDYRKSRNEHRIDPITSGHHRYCDNVSFNTKKNSKENVSIPKKGFQSSYNRDIARKIETRDTLKSPIKNITPLNKTHVPKLRNKDDQLLSKPKSDLDNPKYGHTAKNSPRKSKNSRCNFCFMVCLIRLQRGTQPSSRNSKTMSAGGAAQL